MHMFRKYLIILKLIIMITCQPQTIVQVDIFVRNRRCCAEKLASELDNTKWKYTLIGASIYVYLHLNM